ncbi:MAG: gfo/Idh/MocA family oxidoreductase [Chloroflexi bacterium]|nr:MAG: gfo/Idh/MocA family oxidoreductase [Chloroflexota bacterium]
MTNFALIGAAGYIAPRHLKAIYDTQNTLVAAVDRHDSVGIMDRYFPDAAFFTEIERFERYLEKLRLQGDDARVHYVSICTPNYLHDAHVRLALRTGAHAICEKPLVINPWNLDALEAIEAEQAGNIYTVLQLRLHEPLVQLKAKLDAEPQDTRHDVVLSYVTRRGKWYDYSWKGDEAKSGGVAMNIGIHFFDLCIWMFGAVERCTVHLREARRVAGVLELERARVRWFLSIEKDDLPDGYLAEGKPAYRSMTIDGEEVEFSSGFTDLHTRVYEDILAGGGYRIPDVRPAIQVVYDIRHAEVETRRDDAHPKLKG